VHHDLARGGDQSEEKNEEGKEIITLISRLGAEMLKKKLRTKKA